MLFKYNKSNISCQVKGNVILLYQENYKKIL